MRSVVFLGLLLAVPPEPAVFPDPLVFLNGEKVRTRDDWSRRRAEILRLFETHVYGRTPQVRVRPSFEVQSIDRQALGGKAIRKQIRVNLLGRGGGPWMDLLLYVPAAKRQPAPVFLGLNFDGNHTVHADPGIRLAAVWERDPALKGDGRSNELAPHIRKRAPESARGQAAGQWPVERILARGYALATIYYGDIEPDFAGGIGHGPRPMLTKTIGPGDWGAIGAWAWGLSRAVDYLETDRDVDAKRIALMGHSRLGKTAMWAGAQDERFAIVISNNSGQGGVGLAHRQTGESLEHLNTAFPHWFCANYRQYVKRQLDLPVDGHLLVAMIAPRPVYVASAEGDTFSDPPGEHLSAVAAGPVYELLGRRGYGKDHNAVGYHIRPGPHDVTAYDWDQYLNFADTHITSR